MLVEVEDGMRSPSMGAGSGHGCMSIHTEGEKKIKLILLDKNYTHLIHTHTYLTQKMAQVKQGKV